MLNKAIVVITHDAGCKRRDGCQQITPVFLLHSSAQHIHAYLTNILRRSFPAPRSTLDRTFLCCTDVVVSRLPGEQPLPGSPCKLLLLWQSREPDSSKWSICCQVGCCSGNHHQSRRLCQGGPSHPHDTLLLRYIWRNAHQQGNIRPISHPLTRSTILCIRRTFDRQIPHIHRPPIPF